MDDLLVEIGVLIFCMIFFFLFDIMEEVLDCLECFVLLVGVVFFLVFGGFVFFIFIGFGLFKKLNKVVLVLIFFFVGIFWLVVVLGVVCFIGVLVGLGFAVLVGLEVCSLVGFIGVLTLYEEKLLLVFDDFVGKFCEFVCVNCWVDWEGGGEWIFDEMGSEVLRWVFFLVLWRVWVVDWFNLFRKFLVFLVNFDNYDILYFEGK